MAETEIKKCSKCYLSKTDTQLFFTGYFIIGILYGMFIGQIVMMLIG